MQAMVTVTANDSSPEMLAAIRRGPFAEPSTLAQQLCIRDKLISVEFFFKQAAFACAVRVGTPGASKQTDPLR